MDLQLASTDGEAESLVCPARDSGVESESCGKCTSMAAVTPQNPARNFGVRSGSAFGRLVKESLLRSCGERGCETYFDLVVDKIEEEVFGYELSPSQIMDIPPLVEMEVQTFSKKDAGNLVGFAWNADTDGRTAAGTSASDARIRQFL